jgi:hypothetical protein
MYRHATDARYWYPIVEKRESHGDGASPGESAASI